MTNKVPKELCKKDGIKLISANKQLFNLKNFKISHLIKIYLHLHPHSALRSRVNHFKSFVATFGDSYIKNVNAESLGHWFSIRYNQFNYSERTMCRVKTQLSGFFKWCLNEKLIDSNPLTMVKYRNNVAPKRSKVILSIEEVHELITTLKEGSPNYLYPFIYAITQTGARRSEIMKLKWRDIDLNNDIINFRETKNGTNRRIGMSKGLKELVSSLDKVSSFVFTDDKNRQIRPGIIDKKIKRFKRSHTFHKDWKCHDLRHSFAHNFLKLGRSMHHLKAILGHKSIQMTVDLYGSVEAEHIVDPSPFNF